MVSWHQMKTWIFSIDPFLHRVEAPRQMPSHGAGQKEGQIRPSSKKACHLTCYICTLMTSIVLQMHAHRCFELHCRDCIAEAEAEQSWYLTLSCIS